MLACYEAAVLFITTSIQDYNYDIYRICVAYHSL